MRFLPFLAVFIATEMLVSMYPVIEAKTIRRRPTISTIDLTKSRRALKNKSYRYHWRATRGDKKGHQKKEKFKDYRPSGDESDLKPQPQPKPTVAPVSPPVAPPVTMPVPSPENVRNDNDGERVGGNPRTYDDDNDAFESFEDDNDSKRQDNSEDTGSLDVTYYGWWW